jgi:lipoyl(octanoyl) transferase
MTGELWCVRCGQVPYEEARHLQKRLERSRQAGEIPDVLLLLEHPPVYTKGRRSEPGELGMGEDWYRMQGIEVCETDRGGRVTYHGPGQLVGYPIVSLRDLDAESDGSDGRGMSVPEYVRRLERVMIDSLGAYGVRAGVIDGLTGVWAGERLPEADATVEAVSGAVAAGEIRKIGSIGVHVSRGVTTHGLAVNVDNDLQPFEWIVPCGIEGCRMTSLCRELGAEQELGAFMDVVRERFGEAYGREAVELDPAELASRTGTAMPSGAGRDAAGAPVT